MALLKQLLNLRLSAFKHPSWDCLQQGDLLLAIHVCSIMAQFSQHPITAFATYRHEIRTISMQVHYSLAQDLNASLSISLGLFLPPGQSFH